MVDTRDVTTVERFIAAPANKIFALLADPTRHRDIDGSGSVRDAPGGPQTLALGSKFGMDMHLGFGYSMESTVIEFEQDHRIAWQSRPAQSLIAHVVGGRIWRYQLEPTEGGTKVSESWDISQEKIKQMVRPMRRKTIQAMNATLERIEKIVAA